MKTKEERQKERDEKEQKALHGGRHMGNFGSHGSLNLALEKKFSISLSQIEKLSPETLSPHPKNPYLALDEDELKELIKDIKEKGVLVPLIIRPDNTLLCGHNRLKASLQAGLDEVPVQTVISKLTPDLEQEIMKSENDRRRGGNWSKEKKKEFIQKNFKDEIAKDNRGGNRKTKDQKFTEPLIGKKNLAKDIAEKSRGKIPEGTAKRLLSEIKKAEKTPSKSSQNRNREALPKDRIKSLQKRIKRLKIELREAEKELKKLSSKK